MEMRTYTGAIIVKHEEIEVGKKVVYELEDGTNEECSKEEFEKMTIETKRRTAGWPYQS